MKKVTLSASEIILNLIIMTKHPEDDKKSNAVESRRYPIWMAGYTIKKERCHLFCGIMEENKI